MKKFILWIGCMVVCAAVCAEDKVQIGDLYYILDQTNQTAKVTKDKEDADNYKGLTSITVPNTVTYASVTYAVTAIDERAFMYCAAVTDFTVGSNVTQIGAMSFANCSGATSFICHAVQPPTVNPTVFLGMPVSSIPLTVPAQSIATYRATAVWKNFILPEECTITIESDNESQGKVIVVE